MKTITRQCEEALSSPFGGHSSREPEHRIKILENLVLKLAQQIDNLNYNQ